MKAALREYGLILGLIVISISGYLLFSQHKEDILAYSLDVLGTKLVSLIDDESARARVASAFDRFEEQALNNEISPSQVQFVAANVLNLANSNARLSPEEAELVLSLQPESDSSKLPSPEVPTTPPSPKTKKDVEVARAKLADNINSMIIFANEVADQDSAAVKLVRFETSDTGLHVVLDPAIENHFRSERFSVVRDMLAEKDLVKWEKDVERDAARSARWFERKEKLLAAAETSKVQTQEQSIRIQTLGRMNRLESLGATLAADSTQISREIELIIAETMADLEVMLSENGTTFSVRPVRPDSLKRKRQ